MPRHRIPLILCALCIPLIAPARPVSAKEAGIAAANWLARSPDPLGSGLPSAPVADVRTVKDDSGDALFHAVAIKGGGMVVLSAETAVTPVVAFSGADGLDASDGNPLPAILAADLALRTRLARRAANAKGGAGADAFAAAEAAWERLLGGRSKDASSAIQDVRVSPLLVTRWGQSGGAANYYTPNNYVCGCVALAGAQIARYWGFPTAERPVVQRPCYLSGFEQTFSTKGGTYAWNAMPPVFGTLTDAQKIAIGKLCYDFGVATYMNWGYGGSGTSGFCLGEAFADVFGYASARVYVGARNGAVSDRIVERAVFANLDARCPVSLGIDGHMVDADGYGFADGVPYTHLNMGWEGSGDAWYNLPDVEASNGYESTVLDEIVYNIFPAKTGDLLTGRVLDRDGIPVAGASVRAVHGSDAVPATTDAKGVYALWVAGDRTWSVTASAAGGTAATNVLVDACVSTATEGRDCEQPCTGVVGNLWGVDLRLDVSIAEPPPAPEGLSASQGTRADRVRLSWGAVPGALSYAVFRAESASGTRTQIATCASTSFDDMSAGSGTNYWYWVAGANLGGTGASGGPATGWCADDASTGTFADGLDATQLSWTTSSSSPWTFAEDVSLDGKDSARSGTLSSSGATTWIETEVEGPAQVSFAYAKFFPSGSFRVEVDGEDVRDPDTSQSFNNSSWISVAFEIGSGSHSIRLSWQRGTGAISGKHNGVWVDEFDVAPPGGFPPNVPGNLSASQGMSADAVTLLWDSVKLAASYVVYRADREDVAAAVEIGTAAAEMFIDTTVEAGTTNWYWVVAVNAAGASAYGGPAAGWRTAVAYEDPETRTTPVPVPHAWLDGFPDALAAHGWDYEAFANSTASNGVDAVWQCYVSGVSPTNASERFLARIEFDAAGAPRIGWTPDLNEGGTKTERVYAVEGADSLTNEWGAVGAGSRFFRVRVSLPE